MSLKTLENMVRTSIDMALAGYVLYMYDSDKMQCQIHGLSSLQPLLHLKKFSELFVMNEPAFYWDGKPVFLVIRKFPISIRLDKKIESKVVREHLTKRELSYLVNLLKKQQETTSEKEEKELLSLLAKFNSETSQITLTKQEERMKLTEKGYDSTEFQAKMFSGYTNSIFRKGKITIEWIISCILLVCLAIAITVIIMESQPKDVIEVIRYINQTITEIPENESIWEFY